MTFIESVVRMLRGKRVPRSVHMVDENAVERRRLVDSLIDEHRRANARARTELSRTVPKSNTQYLAAMDRAMAIIKGD